MLASFFSKPIDNPLCPKAGLNPNEASYRKKVCFFYKDMSFFEEVIKELASLEFHFENILTYNWGNILHSNGELQHIYTTLNEQKYISVFIGASTFDSVVLWSSVHSNIYLTNRIPDPYLNQNEKMVNFMGYQRHFLSLNSLSELENNSIHSMGLGQIRSLGNQIEPLLRDTQKAYIDLNVLKSSELPCNPTTGPAGLTTEELCQLLRYIGEANHLSSIMINTDLNNDVHMHNNGAKVMALALWYFLEGVNLRLNDHPIYNTDHQSFLVDLGADTTVVFKRHNGTHRWWLLWEDLTIACSQQEYEECVNGNTPSRLAKLIL
jgi:hypothetical protein